jgi:hypothetical protein
MCINCLKTQVDITEGITKQVRRTSTLAPLLVDAWLAAPQYAQVTIFFCRGCNRYQRPPWVALEWESRELLALCLKKIKGLNKEVKVRNESSAGVRLFSIALCQLVDAGFVYTEPHSRRIKVKLTIQKEVSHSLACFTQSSHCFNQFPGHGRPHSAASLHCRVPAGQPAVHGLPKVLHGAHVEHGRASPPKGVCSCSRFLVRVASLMPLLRCACRVVRRSSTSARSSSWSSC